MKIFANFAQKNGGDPTSQWIAARTGCLTASEFDRFVDLSGKLRSGEMPKTYMAEKLFERWTGRQKPGEFFNIAVNNGIIVESKAALFAEMKYSLEIQHVGFVSNDDGTVGASPDGLIGFANLSKTEPTSYGDGAKLESWSGIEIKSPALYTHIKYLMDGKLPNDYVCQVNGSMFVTGCQTWHFLSYPLACYLDGFQPLHLVIERDEEWQKNFTESLAKFQEKFNAEWDKLVDANGGLPTQKTIRPEDLPPENCDYKV
jgi:hypothetical protein